LTIGKPIMLYIDGKKKDAVLWLVSIAGWFLLFFFLALLVMALK
jgi:hypothetical protein